MEIEVAAIVAGLIALAALQRTIGARTTWPNRFRRIVWPTLDPLGRRLGNRLIGRERPLIRQKDRGEYVCTVNCSQKELQQALNDAGYRRNWILSTLKFVLLPTGEKAWEQGTWNLRETLRAKYKHHTYFFLAAERGYTYHLNAHKEINELHSPMGHMGTDRRAGDPDRTLRDALDAAGITWVRLDRAEYDSGAVL